MNTMRVGAAGAAVLALAAVTACGTSTPPAHPSSASAPATAAAAAASSPPSPPASAPPGSSPPALARPGFAASDVTFVSTQHGWVLGSGQLLALETASGWVWAIAGPQPYPDVWRAPVGSTAWTNLRHPGPGPVRPGLCLR